MLSPDLEVVPTVFTAGESGDGLRVVPAVLVPMA